jgi:hypothetical protein
MSIVVNNFSDIDTLNDVYDSSLCVIFSNREDINIDISSCKSDIIILDLYGDLLEIKKEIWKNTNKACSLLEYYPYKLSNNIWNIFFIEYMNNNRECNGDINLVREKDISGVFGIYDKKNVNISNSINRLFFSNKLKTFVLHDIFESDIENNKYIVGQLMSHLLLKNQNISFKDISNIEYKCPVSWRKFGGNTYGICRNMERMIIKSWNFEEKSYYPIHLLSELKVLYVWLILLLRYMKKKNKEKKGDYKKITYLFSDIEYGKLKKYATDNNIIEYIIEGYLKFIGLKWNKKDLLFEIDIDGKIDEIYPLVESVDDYNIYKKSRWINNSVKNWNVCKNMDKIVINVCIKSDIEKSELMRRDDIFMQIDIGLDKNGKLINVIYMLNNSDLLKWKRILDNFLNMWVK